MDKLLIFVFLIPFISCQAQKNVSKFVWNLDKEKIHSEKRSDSSSWGMKNWASDKENLSIEGRPFIRGVFPEPEYDLKETAFNGIGFSGDWKGIDFLDKKIICHSLFINRNNINAPFIDDKPNEVYFSIVVLTDSIDLKGYTHTNVFHSSRNHPHFMGQGFVKTKSNHVDFMSFLSADRNAYAVVNMRLFDLRIGRIVLIAPQKDRTLRSLQLDAPIMSSNEIDTYIGRLLEQSEEVIAFFTKAGNI